MTAVRLGVPDERATRRRPPLGGENFPVALGVLPTHLRRHLLAVYRYARYVDDLGDRACGDRVLLLREVAADLRRLYEHGEVRDPVVAGLADTVRQCGVPLDPLDRLVQANLKDQRVSRYATFAELRDYCRLSADPVGEIVLHVFGRATADRVALSDRICTALQLLEHWQDVGEDFAMGRVYLPQADLDRFEVTEAELGAPVASEALRALIAFETERALAWLDAGCVLVSTLRGWSRLAVSAYVAGGRAAANRLRGADYDPLRDPAAVKPRKRDVATRWLEGVVRWAG